jgi:aldehyde:ferredoxin oxidoreductase
MQPILRVNLSTRKIDTLDIPPDWWQDYLGGSSLAARILYEQLVPELDPLSPEAPLLFLTGPLSGTAGPAVGRFVVCARSPATGLWGESNCGGFWGPELRNAGFDGLWITGRAQSPVYLWILGQQVEIRDAAHLWGFETYQTQDALLQELNAHGKHRVAVIGPAGEAQIPFAAILTDHGRAAGRTGMGAVMGAKNLKAVAVRHSGKTQLAPDAYSEIRTRANKLLRDDNFTRAARETGTAGIADYANYLGEMPKRYFQSGIFEGVDKVTGTTMTETILTGVSACHACVIACGRVVRLSDEEDKRKGPEYETIVGFGPNLLIDDLAFITRMGDLCDRYGMDTISLSNTLGLAFTLFERGRVNKSDTGGLSLDWGHKEVVETLVHQTARREGFGADLAEGSRLLGRRFGAEELAVQVNGLEVAYHDPRGVSGMALVYATSPRGACHNQSDYFLTDIYGSLEESLGMEFYPRHGGAEKAANVAIHQNWRTVFNSLVMCFFANLSPQSVLELINAATEEDYTLKEILYVGERAWNLKRLINQRLGLARENDRLPKLLREAYQDGGSEGYLVPLEDMLATYYQARGWDAESGMPTPEKLNELGLDWVDNPGD